MYLTIDIGDAKIHAYMYSITVKLRNSFDIYNFILNHIKTYVAVFAHAQNMSRNDCNVKQYYCFIATDKFYLVY